MGRAGLRFHSPNATHMNRSEREEQGLPVMVYAAQQQRFSLAFAGA